MSTPSPSSTARCDQAVTGPRHQEPAAEQKIRALAEPLGKRHRTMFFATTPTHIEALKRSGDKVLDEKRRLAKSMKLAEQISGRDTTREIVEHLPVEPIYVSPERARALQERAWVGPTQRNSLTGEVSHMRRRRVGGCFVTERVEGPAP